MAVELTNSTIGNYLNKIQSNFNGALVAPLNAFGLGGYVFDIDDDSTTVISTDITDHFVEDNTTIQDHIAVKPVSVTLKNFVGEVIDRRDKTSDTTIQKVTQKLTVLSTYLPKISRAATQFQSIFSADHKFDLSRNITSPAADLYSLVKNATQGKTRQEQAFQYFKALAQQKILIGVQTAHEFITNMAIENVIAQQTGITKYMSTFTITLKQMRFAQTANISGPFVVNASNPIAAVQSTAADYAGSFGPQAEAIVEQTSVAGTAASAADLSLTNDTSDWIFDDSQLPENN